jgi:hypothetical protein
MVTLSATVSPVASGALAISGTMQFSVNGAAVGGPVAVNPATGNATYTYPNLLGHGLYPITAAFTSTNPYFLSSSGANTLTVTPEDAVITPWPSNPPSQQVRSPGGTAGPVTLTASVVEANDDTTQGNINNAVVTCALAPLIAGTGTLMAPAITTGGGPGGTITATCTFPSVPVNAYDVQFSAGGSYYTGVSHSGFAVYDPSLGFVTGGGSLMVNGYLVEFGFNAKYLKSGNPQGSLTYVEHRPSGDLVVQGVAPQFLSIVGNAAVFACKATIGSTGNYTVAATVVDNGEPGAGVDQFGLRISNPDGSTFLAVPLTTIIGGNIQAPH